MSNKSQPEFKLHKLSPELFLSYWKRERKPNRKMKKHIEFGKFGFTDEDQVTFCNVEVQGEIIVKKRGNKLPHLMLKNSQIENVKILNTQIGKFWIESCQTGNFLILNNSKTESFLINHSKTGNFIIAISQTGFIRFNNSQSAGILVTKSVIESLSIYNSVVNSVIILEASNVENISISQNAKLAQVDIRNAYLNKFIVGNTCLIGHLRCSFLPNQSAHLVFKNSLFGHIDYENVVFSQSTTLSLSNCKANQITFKNTCNYGSIFFTNVQAVEKFEYFREKENGHLEVDENEKYIFDEKSIDSHFRLIDSDAGMMQIINSNLAGFKKFEFSNSKILNLFVAGTKLPTNQNFYLPQSDTKKQKLYQEKTNRQKRLVFGQFKKIYEKQGDRVTSLQYLALEMEAYRSQLVKEGWRKHKGELFMIWMNKISTNYGTSWQQGVFSTLIALIFFYSILILLVDKYTFDFSFNGLKELGNILSHAPYFLNPLRDKDSIFLIEENDFTPLSRLWDFISRIFLTYFVYQTIQAFRKLGKSSE